jgi:hypothetical protein
MLDVMLITYKLAHIAAQYDSHSVLELDFS